MALGEMNVACLTEFQCAVYADGELLPEATIRKFLIVRQEGARQVSRNLDHYNLDAILAVGYRIRSTRGTQFRRWATERRRSPTSPWWWDRTGGDLRSDMATRA